MNGLANILFRICLTLSAVILTAAVAEAAVPLLPLCSWPVESTGQGFLNVATQDTNTTYWFMPIDTRRWKSVTIHGTYPNARFFNFATYGPTGLLIDTLFDEDITPDKTSTAGGNNVYTVTVGPSSPGSSNLLSVAGSPLAFLVYRVIVPDQGRDRAGGVDVPSVSLVAQDGSERRLRACPFASAESSFGAMIPLLIASGFSQAADFIQSILAAAHQRTSMTGSCTGGQPARPAALTFGPAPGTDFFPNPPTAYLQTPNVCFQRNEVIVVRGKALVYPDTYLGGSESDPAFDGHIQVRYWSMCNNDGVFPYPVVACAGDFQTKLDKDQFYTYVVSIDPAPAETTDPAPAETTWLPWGPTNLPITLIFRSISFDPNYETIPSAYYPQGVICDEAVLTAQGWQGCFAAASIKLAIGP